MIVERGPSPHARVTTEANRRVSATSTSAGQMFGLNAWRGVRDGAPEVGRSRLVEPAIAAPARGRTQTSSEHMFGHMVGRARSPSARPTRLRLAALSTPRTRPATVSPRVVSRRGRVPVSTCSSTSPAAAADTDREAEESAAVADWGLRRCLDLGWPGPGQRGNRCGRRSCPTSAV